jgi:hypothetical protein
VIVKTCIVIVVLGATRPFAWKRLHCLVMDLWNVLVQSEASWIELVTAAVLALILLLIIMFDTKVQFCLLRLDCFLCHVQWNFSSIALYIHLWIETLFSCYDIFLVQVRTNSKFIFYWLVYVLVLFLSLNFELFVVYFLIVFNIFLFQSFQKIVLLHIWDFLVYLLFEGIRIQLLRLYSRNFICSLSLLKEN